jgi:protein MpaA
MDRSSFLVARVCLLVGVLVLSGCYEQEPAPRITGELPPLELPALEPPPARHKLIGRSVQRRPIMAKIVGEGEDTILIMAGIHGDEPAGTALVNQLTDYLRSNLPVLRGRRVVLLPTANPDGMAAKIRENIRRVDLNRNFEAVNRENNEENGFRPLSEPETQALRALLKEYEPGRIVSLHQPLSCIDYDGPGRALATRIAQNCDLPIKKLGAKPGSLGAYTGETLGIPTITLELPPAASNMSETALWEHYGRALLAAIAYPQPAVSLVSLDRP